MYLSHIKLYFWGYDQKYHKFPYFLLLFQQFQLQISQIDKNGYNPFCDEILQMYTYAWKCMLYKHTYYIHRQTHSPTHPCKQNSKEITHHTVCYACKHTFCYTCRQTCLSSHLPRAATQNYSKKMITVLTHSERRPQIFIPKRKSTFIVSSNWQHKFLYFHYKSVKLNVLCRQIKYEHLAILSNLKSCQFAPKIVIFILCICCQLEDSQIISPKIIPMSHRNI